MITSASYRLNYIHTYKNKEILPTILLCTCTRTERKREIRNPRLRNKASHIARSQVELQITKLKFYPILGAYKGTKLRNNVVA